MILIRADANEIIGAGHLMRCLSIARAFADKGEDVRFITADHKGDSLIHSRGFESLCMESEYNAMDSEDIVPVIEEYKPELLIVDSYFVTKEYFDRVNSLCKVAYIDDINEAVWDADFLIDYNIFGTVLDYSGYVNTRTSLLLGPKFAPLRSEFKNVPKHIIKPVSDVMISAGGSDPEKITERIMKEICPIWKEVSFHFVVGALNPRLEKIKALLAPNMVLHINEQNMSGLMQKCDIAISAAGSTLYELCACGTPTITYTLADNQLLAAEEFERQELMINAGDCRNNASFIENLNQKLDYYAGNIEKRKIVSRKMQLLVDGYGAERIVNSLI